MEYPWMPSRVCTSRELWPRHSELEGGSLGGASPSDHKTCPSCRRAYLGSRIPQLLAHTLLQCPQWLGWAEAGSGGLLWVAGTASPAPSVRIGRKLQSEPWASQLPAQYLLLSSWHESKPQGVYHVPRGQPGLHLLHSTVTTGSRTDSHFVPSRSQLVRFGVVISQMPSLTFGLFVCLNQGPH